MADELLRALSVAGITLGVVFASLTVVGIGILVRRTRRGSAGSAPARAIEQRADSALLQLDDAVAESAADVAFASAQFGANRAEAFAGAVASARRDLAEAFELKRRLEDATGEPDRQRREWNRRILTLTERSLRALDAHEHEFSALRAAEATAPERIERVQVRCEQMRARIAEQTRAVSVLAARFDAASIAPVRAALAAASAELDRSGAQLSAAEAGLTGPVTAVGDAISGAERSLQRAETALRTAAEAAGQLEQSAAELERLTGIARAELAEARRRRTAAPDADSADAITRAVAGVEQALVEQSPAEQSPSQQGRGEQGLATANRDPLRAIDRLQLALGRLDTALATARNQEQRLQSAREALDGALFAARSQITTARATIGERSAGTDARSRLAEAERELELAVRTADPVEALDAARRAGTHARDADALARYRG